MELTKIVSGLKTTLNWKTVNGNSQRSSTKRQAYEWIGDLERTYSGQCYERSVREKIHLGSHDQSPPSNAGILFG
jgi:hypothetical protein